MREWHRVRGLTSLPLPHMCYSGNVSHVLDYSCPTPARSSYLSGPRTNECGTKISGIASVIKTKEFEIHNSINLIKGSRVCTKEYVDQNDIRGWVPWWLIYTILNMWQYFVLEKNFRCTSFLGCSLKPHCTLHFSEYNTNAVSKKNYFVYNCAEKMSLSNCVS